MMAIGMWGTINVRGRCSVRVAVLLCVVFLLLNCVCKSMSVCDVAVVVIYIHTHVPRT